MVRPNGLCFVFTLNNYTSAEVAVLDGCGDQVVYLVYGKEVAPTTGTPHIQGYVRMKTRMRFTGVQKILGSRVSLQVAKGGAQSNFDYCSKDGQYVELGERPLEGHELKSNTKKRSRDEKALTFISMCKSHRPLEEVCSNMPGDYLYHGRSMLSGYHSIVPSVVRPEVRVWWLYGPPGVGKSRIVHEVFPDAYIKDPRTKWWNGYMFQKYVILDDFGKKGIDINHLLRWFDRYRCEVENKGGMLALHGVCFLITSNFTPEECFTEEGYSSTGTKVEEAHVQMPALKRRLNVVHVRDRRGVAEYHCDTCDPPIYRGSYECFRSRLLKDVEEIDGLCLQSNSSSSFEEDEDFADAEGA